MVVSSEGLELIKEHEGLRLESYRDPIGIWTVGYGHTRNAKEGLKISQATADRWLRDDVGVAEDAVNQFVLGKGIPLKQHQFDALVSLVFNVGSHNIFTKVYKNGFPFGSTLYNRLLTLDYTGAGDRFLDFVRAGGQIFKGLQRRRKAEKDLFLKGDNGLVSAVYGAISGTVIMWILGRAANVF